ncbi:MAG: T9SS type A sorting domain-containing protein [Crocinitomicaceae bacterium]
MKKIYLSCTALFAAFAAFSQITITSAANTAQVGDSFDYVIIPNYTFNVSQNGANQTWDFSSASGNTQSYSYISLANAVEPTTYATANLVEQASGAENYYTVTTNSLTNVGSLFPGVLRVVYTDPKEFVKFPMTFNDTHNETFSGTAENIAASYTTNRGGTTIITATGYGELILPYTTIPNVLKVVSVSTYTDEFNGTVVGSYIDSIVFWYNPLNNNFLANTTRTYSNGNLLLSQAVYMSETNFVSSVEEIENESSNPLMFPNPAIDQVTIENEMSDIAIYDISGKLVKSIIGTENMQIIDLKDLNAGIYMVSFSKNNARITKKLVIE